MTGKQRMLKTLRFEQPDRPPHFESMFELEKEAFGERFPLPGDWAGYDGGQKERAIAHCMSIYEKIVERYHWDALAVYWPWGDPDGVAAARKTFGEKILIGGMVGGAVWCIDTISDWEQFALDLLEDRGKLHAIAHERCGRALDLIDRMCDAGADFIYLPHDVAGNSGPFVSPKDFAEITAPYWNRLVQRVHQRGALAFLHSDGNLMSVLDQLLAMNADALQSIDPMAGMDIAQVKRATWQKLALMGNVQCNLLQDGPPAAIRRSALYCLENASVGGGYIFSTSNTIFAGMPLENYQFMLKVFEEFNRGGAV